ncbi:MAG: hypothetical protein ACI9UO_003081, partial [Nitrospinales bacterium]
RKLNVSVTLLLRQNKKYSTTHWYIITPPFSCKRSLAVNSGLGYFILSLYAG